MDLLDVGVVLDGSLIKDQAHFENRGRSVTSRGISVRMFDSEKLCKRFVQSMIHGRGFNQILELDSMVTL